MQAAAEVVGARLAALDNQVTDRVAGADLIVAGTVVSIEELGLDGIAEGTTWRRALVRVSTVLKGQAGAEAMIQFPGAGSPRWATAPRLVLDQQGVFILRRPSREPRMRKVKASGVWVALDPNDVHASSALARIEGLVRMAALQTPRRPEPVSRRLAMPLRVVNVTPNVLSNETSGDNEPSIAVDGANPQRIAITTFTPDPAGSGSAPIYTSTDGGVNWATVVCLPGGNTTGDTSIHFAGQTGNLYAGILRADNGNMAILRSAFPPAGLMTQLISRAGPDQPWVVASWAGVPGGTAERVYVTSNDGGQAAVQFSLDAATAAAPAGFGAALNLQLRPGSSRPSVRGAIHRSGRIYITFVHTTAGLSDIVVMRDDAWGGNNFADLVDGGNAIAGVRVVAGVTVPPVGTLLGTQRVSSRIAIAVDPRNRQRVYLAWCDGAVTARLAVHAARAAIRQRRRDLDRRLAHDRQRHENPGLAVNVQGVAALMYQQLVTWPAPTAGTRCSNARQTASPPLPRRPCWPTRRRASASAWPAISAISRT